MLSKYQCNIFEYKLQKDIQGRVDGSKGIFFNIEKIEVVCFNTDIGFVLIKAIVEDETSFANILNFNYKFRDINQEGKILNSYDNIRLQTGQFKDVETFRDLIKNITESDVDAMKLDINVERFLTYSYVCVDQEAWNSTNEFDKIKHHFIKYANIESADSNVNVDAIRDEEIVTLSKWKYAKLALTKQSVALLSSSADMNNYTILPSEYENQYLYTYILNLYKKIYLKKLQEEFKDSRKVDDARKKFAEFTKKLWVQEITEDETGTELDSKMGETLELEKLYAEVKSKYDVLYKDMNIEKNRKLIIIIAIMLGVSLTLNIINFMVLMRK